jgi:hypothetical protein
MFRHGLRVVRRVTMGIALAMLLVPPGAMAQSGDPQDPAGGQRNRPAPDFLLQRPYGLLGLRGSWVFSRAGSDIFDFVQDQLTIDKGDFNGPAVATDVSFALTRQVEIVGGFQFNRVSISSEYRDLIDNNGQAITQQTGLKELDLSASVKWALKPRGREVSRLVWVPRTLTPYVGAGGGMLWYEFEQYGDFVDFVDSSVFTDFFRSSGWTPSVHAFGGVDIHVYKRLLVTMEGRYLWASKTLGRDFIDFDPIDLSGFRMSAGVSVLY